MKYTLITGNLSSGFDAWGPFDNAKDAVEYAQIHHDEWQALLLNPPAERTQ